MEKKLMAEREIECIKESVRNTRTRIAAKEDATDEVIIDQSKGDKYTVITGLM